MIPKPTKYRTIKLSYRVLVPLFDSGLSTRQIAEQLNVSKSRIHKMLHDIALGRDQSSAAIIRQPAKSNHWRSSRQAARQIWKRLNGPIPKGHHIHHIDKDFTNNEISNLECLSSAEHMKLHHAGPEYAIPRHLRPARRAYMKKYLKEYNAS